MIVSKGTVVSIDYTLKDDEGNILDSSEGRGPLTFLQGYGNIIPGLESALEGCAEEEEKEVRVEPEQAYGTVRPEMIQIVPKDRFQGMEGEIEEGMQFHARTEEGGMVSVRVVKIEGDEVTIDGNHPLAGMALNFAVGVREIRLASAEELEHGHVHTEGGCCGGSQHPEGCEEHQKNGGSCGCD